MTELPPTQDQEKKNNAAKKQNFLIKFSIFFSLIFFGYYGFKYWQTQERQRLAAKSEIEKYDNIDSEIFDLSPSHENQASDADPHGLSDLAVSELKEKGAEFIYQMLLKNQMQINDLNKQIQGLRGEILQYKNREKIGKMIFIYVDLRQKFSAGQPYEEPLKNFEILAAFDEKLQDKIAKLKGALPNFSTKEKLSKSFSKLIPELIATKNNHPDSSLVSKIRRNLSRLIIIRKIDEKTAEDLDLTIIKTEKFLRAENYQEALISTLSLSQNYHEILREFLNDLSASAELQKIDEEILNYLKSLS
jgi:hypothetical protein